MTTSNTVYFLGGAIFAIIGILFMIEAMYAHKASKLGNICLGPKAGESLTVETGQFRMRFDPNDIEYATTLSYKEYKTIKKVLERANKIYPSSKEIDKIVSEGNIPYTESDKSILHFGRNIGDPDAKYISIDPNYKSFKDNAGNNHIVGYVPEGEKKYKGNTPK